MSSRKKHKQTVTPTPLTRVTTPPRKPGFLASLAIGLLLGSVIGGGVAAFFYFSRPKVIDLGVINSSSIDDPNPPPLTPDKELFATYAGSASCRACHAKEYDAWGKSHHALAERPIDPKIDRRAFDPPRGFDHGTQHTDVRMAGDQFQVVTAGPGGKVEAFAVARVIGESPLRQFLVPFPGGRMQTLEATYDPHKDQWFNVYGSEDRRPGEWGHWTGRGMNWNSQCAACHNTRVRKNYDDASDTYKTTMAEPTVSCESCHGPMKQHAATIRSGLAASAASSSRPTTQAYRFTKDQTLQTCASCHARRGDLTGEFVPGDSFHDHYALDVPNLSENFYPDGQVKEEDYEFTAFLGSKMHAAGVRCADCHEPHSAKPLFDGNNLCMRCHNGSFKGSPLIVPEQHSFHKADSPGNQCVNCHMPQTTYMQRHARHDHGFTTPDPVLTKDFDIPNACNRCHTDKSADWAIDATDKRYGEKMQRPARDRARLIAKARHGDEAVREPLVAMLKSDKQAFWQAVAAAALAQWAATPDVRDALTAALNHADPLVREQAASSLSPLAQGDNALPPVRQALGRRLTDPVRAVRLRAAWALHANLNPQSPPGRELLAQLAYGADQPLGASLLAAYHLDHKDVDGAVAYATKAANWNPNVAAQRDVLASALILQGHTQAAAEQFAIAAKLDPREVRYPYMLALAYDRLGRFEDAVKTLRQAEAAHPRNAEIPYTRATMHLKLNQRDAAKDAARRAVELNPNYEDAQILLRNLR